MNNFNITGIEGVANASEDDLAKVIGRSQAQKLESLLRLSKTPQS